MGDLTFRRIHGRIVPIRKSGSSSIVKHAPVVQPKVAEAPSKKRAAFSITSGLSLAAIGGVIAGKLDRAHATLYNTARNARSDLFQRKFAARTRLESIRTGSAATRIKKGSAIFGAALIGAGVHETLKDTDLSAQQKAAIATTSGLGAHFAIRTMHTRFLGNTSFKYAAAHAIKRILVRGHRL